MGRVCVLPRELFRRIGVCSNRACSLHSSLGSSLASSLVALSQTMLRAVLANEGQLVMVLGGTSVGKSFLLEKLAEELQADADGELQFGPVLARGTQLLAFAAHTSIPCLSLLRPH